MKVSLNWIKKYIDIPSDITPDKVAYDLTLRTVEVEGVEYTGKKYENIIVGKILEVNAHPDADKLRVCIVDIGKDEPVQIVCGGSNLYENENVVVCVPGAKVYWHGEGDLVEIKETKMRGVSSYGMICAGEEVFLDKLFPSKDDHEIVDLGNIDAKPGTNIAEALKLDDVVLEIDNKSLTNRPDLWGHYGIAREIAAIYDLPLKKLENIEIDKNLPKYDVVIEEPDKCKRYTATVIDNVYEKESPLWMKNALINAGMRPINAIVDITNYAMLATGQPMHAFDKTHVEGNKIIVRNAKKGEELLLLDGNKIELTEEDLVIANEKEVMGLAGIKGGSKDSILPETTSIVLEVANFSAETIRKTDKRFDEKTDAAIRYEKNIDTERVSEGLSLAVNLFSKIFKESKVVAFAEEYPVKTQRAVIDVDKEFLDVRLGKVLDKEVITKVLTSLGYDVTFDGKTFKCIAPIFRSTGDVSIKDDVMGDIARLLSFDSFEAKPLEIKFTHAVKNNKVLLERRIREYLAIRCGFYEIFTYPWIDIKYINAAKIDTSKCVELATPPAPELKVLRSSLIPGMLEAISKNLRYFDEFKLFEMTEVYEKGEYHESTLEETLPIHKKYLTGVIVKKNAKDAFLEMKGVIENMSSYTHMENLTFEKEEKPAWADINAYLSVKLGEKTVGYIGLLSLPVMNEAKIKRANVMIMELNFDEFIPFESRTNEFTHLPVVPLVEKDLSIIVDEEVTWKEIKEIIEKRVSDLEFIEEYRGNQVPDKKKSITLRFKLGDGISTLTAEDITSKLNSIIRALENRCGATLREI